MAEELKNPITEGQDPEVEQEKEPAKKEAKYTDDDIDRIIAKKFAKWETEKKKEIDEAKKLEQMNAQQKAEYERDQLQQKLDELMKKDARATMIAESRRSLSAAGINAPDELITLFVNPDDATSTKEAVDTFIGLYKDAVKAGITEALKGKTPKSGGTGAITKEEIMKIADRAERQRLINEHIELFRH